MQILGIRTDDDESPRFRSAEALPVLLNVSKKNGVLKIAAMNALFLSGLNGHNVPALAAGLSDGDGAIL